MLFRTYVCGFALSQENKMFQVFQLRALVICGTAARGEKLVTNLEQVAFKEGDVRGVLLCPQDLFRSPHLTQGSFSSESVSTMLSESVAIADSIRS